MADTRSHRGAHPEDNKLFAAEHIPVLRRAVADLSWLLGGGYTDRAALKLVGDHFCLTERQRLAVLRSACSDSARASRRMHRLDPSSAAGQTLWIDGFNALMTIEAALGGAVILRCRDGSYRDMASIHGSYRKVAESGPAVMLFYQAAAQLGVATCRFLLDAPVSNSGRLRALILDTAKQLGCDSSVELSANPDRDLIALPAQAVVVTADSVILDRRSALGAKWLSLPRLVVEAHAPSAWLVDLDDRADAL